MRTNTNDRGLVILGAVTVIGAVLLFFFLAQDSKDWKQYKQEHHCVETGEKKRQLLYTGRSPVAVTQYQYRCDDGELVWHR